jgi:structural maintenance of chromosome 1
LNGPPQDECNKAETDRNVNQQIKASPMGGVATVAYLSLKDSEVCHFLDVSLLPASDDFPYAAGTKYHAMPPMKCFRDMEQLSCGEKL